MKDNKISKQLVNIVICILVVAIGLLVIIFKGDPNTYSSIVSKRVPKNMISTTIESVTKSMNNANTGNTASVPGLSNPGSGAMDGTPEENKKFIWDYLTSHGLSEIQAAAALGSMQVETGGTFKGHTMEGNYLPSFPPWDHDAADYAKCNDYCLNYLFPRCSCWEQGYLYNGQYLEGIGIAQWTANRHVKLVEFAAQNNSTWDNLELQCMMVIHEVVNGDYRASVYDRTVNASSVEDAAYNWRRYYEAGGGANFYGKNECQVNARAIYNQFHH